ncbi:2-polyprenyl-3-methyl-6-methoxy-1,4-benzoquinone monooxygenase [Dasania marina]|uniref:2-polyprenyl-3-methyl-6-methoxy-1,4-benzoquinone monooxygenase n=1 Tax=Dasania marina TaxID=471499 RepID=UPI0003699C2F|nr:2-polyprenyl-3-methyl-6-methoxy-1,4-benzoquinone monooxygenase [Dasania marina]
MQRLLSPLDKLIVNADQALRTLIPTAATATRKNPADKCEPNSFDASTRKHIAGLMRINHTGEVCAQALYQGQALTAKLEHVRAEMEHAAEEEIDHLVWCEQRLQQLGSHTSLLNPAFYAISFSLGALAGLAGDKWSLGFVAATEERVCHHLESHLQLLPDDDKASRAILEAMLIDERLHGSNALAAGGVDFSDTLKNLMSATSSLMTKTTYYI